MAIEKSAKYSDALRQIISLVEDEQDLVANLSNIAAVLKSSFDFWWTGFYFVRQNELVLGPFQGPVACTRIGFGKGVCGTAWERRESVVVPDVHRFPGHIACNSESNSEIVVPVLKNGEVVMVLDIDSRNFNEFDETDRANLEQLAQLISDKLVS